MNVYVNPRKILKNRVTSIVTCLVKKIIQKYHSAQECLLFLT